MNDQTRHERFREAQDNAWRHASLSDEASTQGTREHHHAKAVMWAQVAEALRREPTYT